MTVQRTRRGFSIIELLVVMTIIGLLARIAVPHYTDMKRRAIAASIMGDMQTIRMATYTFYTERSTWPPDYGPGIVPAELRDLLPKDFPFTHPESTAGIHRGPVGDLRRSAPRGANPEAGRQGLRAVRLGQQSYVLSGRRLRYLRRRGGECLTGRPCERPVGVFGMMDRVAGAGFEPATFGL